MERIAIVTAGLSGAGAVLGAVCAASSVATIALLAGGVHALGSAGTPALLGVAAGFGALVGALGAPILGWGLLRRVPLGRVLAVTTLGTIVGAVAGDQLRALDPFPATLPGVIAGALLGFLLSGIVLRVRPWWGSRRPRSDAPSRMPRTPPNMSLDESLAKKAGNTVRAMKSS